MHARSFVSMVGVLLLVVGLLVPFAHVSPPDELRPAATGELSIVSLTPAPNSTVASLTSTISASFQDTSGAPVNPASVFLYVNLQNVTAVDSVTITPQKITYTPPSILPLHNGVNNVTIDASDALGNTASVTWNFTVNTNLTTTSNPFSGVKPATIVFDTAIIAAIAGAAVGGYILYLKQTSRFTFRRYFATHPVKTKYLVVYIPAVAAFLVILFGLDYVYNTPGLPPQAPDYVLIIGIFVGLTAWGVDSRREMHRTRAYERAFSQLLFEMADAMRGGIDPAKAIVELSKTHTNILRKHLRVAADGIRLGRPFEVVIRDMAVPMNSDLISRYSSLIADATGVGGEIATVVYRAAKDMDDFVKIEEEREKQLMLPVAVVYIAFGVLVAVLIALIYIAPDLGTLNINFLGSNPLAGAGSGKAVAAPTVPPLSQGSLRERFFELLIINGLGTGAIIGAFTEGRARYGILHSLGLVAGIAVVFAILFPG